MGFGCWKNGCGVRCGEERKTTRRVWAARRSTRRRERWQGRGPEEEHRTDALQRRRRASRARWVAGRRPRRPPATRCRSAREGARTGTRARADRPRAPDPAGGSRYQDRRHCRPCHEDLARVGGSRTEQIIASARSRGVSLSRRKLSDETGDGGLVEVHLRSSPGGRGPSQEAPPKARLPRCHHVRPSCHPRKRMPDLGAASGASPVEELTDIAGHAHPIAAASNEMV